MLAESETELRDLVVKNLETCGFLNKIKAELRAGVFLALTEEDDLQKKLPVTNKMLEDFIKTDEGKLTLSIVREFLEYYNFHFTLSIFDPEIGTSAPFISRSELHKKLSLDNLHHESILSSLIKQKSTSRATFDSFSEKTRELDTISEDFSLRTKETEKPSNFPELQKTFISEKCLIDSKTENILMNKSEIKSDALRRDSANSLSQSLNILKTEKDIFKNDSANILSQALNKSKADENIFSFTLAEQKDIFKENSSIGDPFFDDPVPLEKSSFLNLSNLGDQFKVSDKTDKSSLSSLKDLPSLNTQNDLFTKTSSSTDVTDRLNTFKKEESSRKELDPESNEESSDKQLNSEESIEEDIEEDFSAGLEDLLNSSLSLGEDATSDQTVSQASVVEGVDHIESCDSKN